MMYLVRTEWTKAVRRSRTLVLTAALAGLPVLISVALHTRGARRERNGEGLFRLARTSGLMVPPAVLAAMSGFLLVVVAGILAGDAVAGDASWGNLRYLLVRPVRRVRLLVAKAAVAGVLIWLAVLVVAVAALISGMALFGLNPVVVPAGLTGTAAGFELSTTTLLVRTAMAAGYVAFGFSALLALGVLFSTLTDSPAGAIGATIGTYIVSEILDGITAFGVLRYGLPTHYLDAWQAMFTTNRYSSDLLVGLAVQAAYLAVFGAAALWSFSRKDIAS